MRSHFDYHTKCPGPCRQPITEIRFDDGEVEIVAQVEANIDGAVAGEEEEVERQQWLIARGYDAAAIAAQQNASLQAAELAALDGSNHNLEQLALVRQQIQQSAAWQAQLLEEWMVVLQERAPAVD